MRRHWNLRIDGEVSPALLDGTDEIQRVMCGWYRKFRQIHIDAQRKVYPVHVQPDFVATFFSGGVDSFFTLQQHKDEITHLVFVHGFDIRIDDRPRQQEMAQNARRVAEQLQLQLVEVETNMRDFGDPHVSWPDAYHGAGMAAIALLLAPRFKRIYIPSTFSWDQQFPYGSHPELDRHWSNGHIDIVHDSVEHNRFEKIQAIADWPIIANHLRICYGSKHQGLNCGRCKKCLWTMIVLESIGRLDMMNTLPHEIDLQALKQYLPYKKDPRERFIKSIACLEARGANTELLAVLHELVEKGDRYTKETRLNRLWKKAIKYLR
ncbi:MAG: hypothetical protein KAU29_11560 [Gammaproteobacteria bacterium]|nr:hypothetical protein [Gammaproteobacteria bacterium]